MFYKIKAVTAIIFFMMIAICCQQNNSAETSNLAVILDDSSKLIIDRAIEYAGGYDNWLQKKSISFDKKSISYDTSGNVIRQVEQHFDYMMKPEFRSKITYMLNDTAITVIHDGQRARKLYNGKVSNKQKDIDGAWNSSFGSQFVMCMPYKLKDPGIKAEYLGRVKLTDGLLAQVIKTSYVKGAGSNPDHIWYYYFEPGTGKLLANSLNWKNSNWDYTRYEQFEKADGLMMPALRKGYSADTLNSPGKMISESRHSNIVINKEFPEDHFKIPDEPASN